MKDSKYIKPGEIETRQLLSLLNRAKKKSSDAPYALEMIYHQYCRGYWFLKEIALGFGFIVACPHPMANHWIELKKSEQEALLNGFYPKLTTEVEHVISLLKSEAIILTGEENYMEYACYIDNRDEHCRAY